MLTTDGTGYFYKAIKEITSLGKKEENEKFGIMRHAGLKNATCTV